jgi:DNA polymerase-1
MKKKLLLIDANSLIHRSFHAIPGLTNKAGEPTGALYGLSNTLLKILKDEQPDFVAAAFDRPERTFRKELDESYKAHRPKAPDELVQQIIRAREVFDAFSVRWFEAPGFEADDIIGTLAEKFSAKTNVLILTGDLDSLQLVKDGNISVITFKKGVSETIRYDEARVKERFGVTPQQVVDYKALVGDASDNISGVAGIGAKSAEKLLNEFQSVEDILETKKDSPLIKKIQENKKDALHSKILATIRKNVPLKVILDDLAWKNNENLVVELLKKLEFESLLRRMGKTSGVIVKKTEKTEETLPMRFVEVSYEGKKIKAAASWKALIRDAIQNKKQLTINASCFDVGLAGWLLGPDKKTYDVPALYERFLRAEQENNFSAIETLTPILLQKLKEENLLAVYENFELPLIPALAEMEEFGICVNTKKLKELSKESAEEIKILSEKIKTYSSEEINLNSTREIAHLLFDVLKIKTPKKHATKTGLRSTREEVLEEIKDAHPIVPLLLAYRENTKIQNTYIEPLQLYAKESGIIHTTFIQTGTSTGRLSSEKPNLQNIPQESQWSERIRDAFEARTGYSFISLDYSQLELRVIAHISKDKNLTQAFRENKDIHTITAEKIFKKKDISAQDRRVAKTLNFGLAYGMGPRLFSKAANVSFVEAKKYIEEYFSEFEGVRVWQEKEKISVKKLGFCENENGRKRWFSQFQNPAEVERAAVNMPIQSLGADIMKRAIIDSRNYILAHKLSDRVKMVLTIHDELIFEIRDDILEATAPELISVSEHCYKLSVPLLVEAKSGKTLGKLKKNSYGRLL